MFTKLGQSIINKVAKLKYRIIAPVEEMKAKFEVSCPSKEEMVKIIKKRNEMVKVLNQLNKNIIVIDKTTKPIKPILTALSTAITVLKAAPAPATGLTAGSIVLLADSLDLAKVKVDGLKAGVSAFAAIKSYILKTISELKEFLNSLDLMINHCLEEQNISSNGENGTINNPNGNSNDNSNSNLDENGNTSFNSSDGSTKLIEMTETEFVDEILTQGENDLLTKLEDNDANETNSYKGFRFAIMNDTQSKSKFPKRYAVAKGASGVILLRGESSFSSSVQILIDELKFQIDRDDLKAF
jgi:hypothetical protein